jgi:hypothetical protein
MLARAKQSIGMTEIGGVPAGFGRASVTDLPASGRRRLPLARFSQRAISGKCLRAEAAAAALAYTARFTPTAELHAGSALPPAGFPECCPTLILLLACHALQA